MVSPIKWVWRFNLVNILKSNHKYINFGLPLAIIITFLLLMLALYPTLNDFEFDADEGINLMKATLMVKGYPLYKEIWSDQPPILTFILAAIFQKFGPNVDIARFVILIFSCILLASSGYFLWVSGGNYHALVGMIFIILLPHYAILSISVMVGLPALALAMVSMAALVTWHKKRGYSWLIVSAITLSLSVLTKLFAGFLAPIFVIGIIATETLHPANQNWRNRLQAACLWSLVFSTLTFTLLILTIGDNISQIYETHLAAQKAMFYDGFFQKTALLEIRAILFLTILGIFLLIRAKRWLSLYLVAWLGVGTLLLTRHAPIWYHQELLITIPAAMIAGYAVGEAIEWVRQLFHWKNLFSYKGIIFVIILSGAIFVLIDQIPTTVALFNKRAFSSDSESSYQLAAKMATYAPYTKWVVTDHLMVAFRAKTVVPPQLAVFSRKRVTTGDLTEQDVVKIIQETKPEQLLITRFRWPSIKFIEENFYTEIADNLYLRNDLPK